MLAEWLYEAGIGENRAALVADGAIIEAAIEVEDGAPRVGAVLPARLIEAGARPIVAFSGEEAILSGVPRGVTQGATLLVEITREPIPEPGRPKRAKAVPAAPDAVERAGASLLVRLDASAFPVRRLHPHEPDRLEAAGWSELLEEARTGEITFPSGALRMSLTPAMTLFDVDGSGAPETLAIAAARAVGAAIRRHGIGGSIGVDFPTVTGRGPRQAIAAALDAVLPPPFERTAVNGFGFLQIVRPRPRASLPELLHADPVGAETRATLRSVERTPPGAPRQRRFQAAVAARINEHPAWPAELTRRTGVVPAIESI